jgi:molybdate transport system substrate-binding protein
MNKFLKLAKARQRLRWAAMFLVAVMVFGMMVAGAIAGCTARSNVPLSQNLTLSAAASLQNALTAIDPLFKQGHAHTAIAYNWGASGALQQQIEQGAPADLFFPASPQQMDALAEQGLIRNGSRRDLLGNQLVLIAPQRSALKGFEDLKSLSSGRIAVGEFASVPAGQYAQATLTYFKLLPQLSSQLVFFNNVRGVLAAVESGNADAGLVYLSDAQLSKQVKIVAAAPPQSHPPIIYPIALLQRSEQAVAAQAYIDFLITPAAAQIFQQFGFIPLHP